ncbi:hypothetical protein [Virgibacillus sp. SK37]|uniref:hypothetical protein n=1 Tax=Virgibacillus sp. SK37 TaxID=403957 RepID=UPI0004D1B5E8|nr:hypothetical protein [Virgibacillus sp. SK37]AIF45088.1 hypothetical protein X953_01400 [Virgibacillus sp. SK37]
MGIYIGLDIIPNYIDQDDWENVFEETLQLIRAYPFATLITENMGDYQRIVLDRTEEQCVNRFSGKEMYWKLNGDLESKETGESFTLLSNLARYKGLKGERLKEDILQYYVEDKGNGAREVFYSKTQGKDYHTYLLAIASLIESRFPKYACVYGDITKEQAQKAVNWANSILDKPIDLPVRVNPTRLLERLEVISIEEKRLEALYDLSIGANDGVDGLVAKHFNINAVRNYFAKELQDFNSAAQLGAELIIIRCLNARVPLEILTDICCFDSEGPRFNSTDFAKGICSSWVFIETEIRGYMDALKKVPDSPETVEAQFGNIFLDMGYMGRRTRRYIPKAKVLKVLKEKFHDFEEIEETINTCYQKNVVMLEANGEKLRKIEEELSDKTDRKIISSYDELIFWDGKTVINEDIQKVIVTISKKVNNILSQKDNQTTQLLEEIKKSGQLMTLTGKLIQSHQLVLTRMAWNWIEKNNNKNLMKIVMLLSLLENSNDGLRYLYKAMLENKSLFRKYM